MICNEIKFPRSQTVLTSDLNTTEILDSEMQSREANNSHLIVSYILDDSNSIFCIDLIVKMFHYALHFVARF